MAMQTRLPQIASLTADYDAIEQAIRETSRGRWFLTTYLERNRSAETRMLLDAIGKLERSMRDNGHIADAMGSMETLMGLRDTIVHAREDIAKTRKRSDSPAWLPIPRFTFDSLSSEITDETRGIRAAAANLQTAATALRSAGLFQGVAQQIGERVEDIIAACDAQDAAMKSMDRMAALVSELEAEIMGALDGGHADASMSEAYSTPSMPCETMQFPVSAQVQQTSEPTFTIPDEVVIELSEALAECFDDDDDEEPFPDFR
jgi:chemotaxis regulatin CheY-phosphate phosphatase CheZ